MKQAEEAVRRFRERQGFREEIVYDQSKVIETERSWYIPYTWIGCMGFIVSKDDLYVNWLGSVYGLSVEHCLWGHEHGVFCDLVDFTFSPDTDKDLVGRLIPKFQHMHPNARGKLPLEPVWYRDSEVEAAIASQFPAFKRHNVWCCIPLLYDAWEKKGLRFTSVLAKEM